MLAAHSITLQHVMEPIASKAMNALYTTIFNGEIGFFDIILEGNALRIMKKVNFATPCFSSSGHFIKYIKLDLGSLRTSSVEHVKRKANLVEHGLARKATTQVVDIL